MMSFLHALAATAWVFLVVVAGATLVAKLWLSWRLDGLESPAAFDRPDVAAALLLPSFLPVVWLVSALAHTGGGNLQQACREWFLQAEGWGAELLFLAPLVVLGVYHAASALRSWWAGHARHASECFDTLEDRVEAVCRTHPKLRGVAGDIRIVSCPDGICAVRGYFSPNIEISAELVERLDDAALRAALLHEVAHLAHGDQIRLLAEMSARVINPFSRVLEREFRAWRFAREIQCDRVAVAAGADGVHLADALVTSARTSRTATPAAAGSRLCGCNTSSFEARVQLLLHADPSRPVRAARNPFAYLAIPLAVGVLAPHFLGGALLKAHTFVELVFL